MTPSSAKKVGRKPKGINPTVGPWHAFCAELRDLKEQAGDPTFAQLAQAIRYVRYTSPNTLSRAVGIRTRPDGSLIFGKWDYIGPYVDALGGDVAYFRARYEDAIRATGAVPPLNELPSKPEKQPEDRHPRSRLRKILAEKTRTTTREGLTLALTVLLTLMAFFSGQQQSPSTGPALCESTAGICAGTWGRVELASNVTSAPLLSAPRADGAQVAALPPQTVLRLNCWVGDSALIDQRNQMLANLNQARQALEQEVDGTGGSGRAGRGPAARQDEEIVQRYENLLAQTRVIQSEVDRSTWFQADTFHNNYNENTSGWISKAYVLVDTANDSTWDNRPRCGS